jgi:hypothetical protein
LLIGAIEGQSACQSLMTSSCNRRNTYRYLAIAGVLGLFLASCTVVGPSAIRSGRLAYNAAINETNRQQMLMSVIQHRYEETGSLLAVTSVTANVSVTTSTGIQLGFGDKENYSGNLVPFSAGTVYEENPTISYAPAVGAEYARRVFAPVPLAMLAQMTGTLADPGYVYEALVSSVNGIQNLDFRFSAADPDPRFRRFVARMTTLTQANRLHWVETPGQPGGFSIVINRHLPAYTAEVRNSRTCRGASRRGS